MKNVVYIFCNKRIPFHSKNLFSPQNALFELYNLFIQNVRWGLNKHYEPKYFREDSVFTKLNLVTCRLMWLLSALWHFLRRWFVALRIYFYYPLWFQCWRHKGPWREMLKVSVTEGPTNISLSLPPLLTKGQPLSAAKGPLRSLKNKDTENEKKVVMELGVKTGPLLPCPFLLLILLTKQ